MPVAVPRERGQTAELVKLQIEAPTQANSALPRCLCKEGDVDRLSSIMKVFSAIKLLEEVLVSFT